MDERRCLEVLRELRSLAWTCGMDSTYLIASDEVAALDHAIATIERVAGAPVVTVYKNGIPHPPAVLIGQRVRLLRIHDEMNRMDRE